MGNLFFSFIKKIKTYSIIIPQDKILIGFSGGPDSQCLLSLLFKYKKKVPIEIGIAHVNYRGNDPKNQELLKSIKLLANKKEIRFHSLEVDLRIKLNIVSIQNEARDIRYDFFLSTAKKYNYTKIAIAHHMDDQVETFLFKLFNKASYKKGLISMGYSSLFRNFCIIRPLIFFYKKDIMDYLKKNSISYFVDLSNKKPIYSRNKIRLEILPKIEEYFPNIKKNILSWKRKFKEEENHFKILLKEVLKKITFYQSKNEYYIYLNKWYKLSNLFKKKVFYEISNKISDKYIFLQEKCFKNIFKIIQERKKNYITLFQKNNFIIIIENNFIVFFNRKIMSKKGEKKIVLKNINKQSIIFFNSLLKISKINTIKRESFICKYPILYCRISKLTYFKIKYIDKNRFFSLENGKKKKYGIFYKKKKFPPVKEKSQLYFYLRMKML